MIYCNQKLECAELDDDDDDDDDDDCVINIERKCIG